MPQRNVWILLFLIAGMAPGYALPVNVALAGLGGVATLSSTFPGSSAALCNDGITDGNYFNGSVCATNGDANGWWEVTFAADYAIVSIDIFNRTDCCDTRINPFTLFLYDAAHTQIWTSGSGQTMGSFASFPVPGMVARTARVQLDRTDYLNLAEIQVFSDSSTVPEPGTLTTLGLVLATGLRYWRKRR